MNSDVNSRLYAKTNGKDGGHKIIFSNKAEIEQTDFFDIPDIDTGKLYEYNPEMNLEIDEWFYIDLDDEHMQCVEEYIINAADSVNINPIESSDYSKIIAVYKTFGVDKVSFVLEKITNSSRITNRRFLNLFGDHPELIMQQSSIIFSGKVDAYFDGERRIYFKSFSTIRSLFDGIEDYYREATQSEVEEFCACSILQVADHATDKIGIRSLKRIAAIMADPEINLKDDKFLQKLKTYACKYPESQLQLEDEKIVINNEKDLSAFTMLAGGRYYKSELTGEKMAATSATKLKQS